MIRLLEERPRCERCGKTPPVDIHEVISRGRSGGVKGWLWLHEPNLLALCRPCHTWVTENPEEAEATGFTAPSCQDAMVDSVLEEADRLRTLGT